MKDRILKKKLDKLDKFIVNNGSKKPLGIYRVNEWGIIWPRTSKIETKNRKYKYIR